MKIFLFVIHVVALVFLQMGLLVELPFSISLMEVGLVFLLFQLLSLNKDQAAVLLLNVGAVGLVVLSTHQVFAVPPLPEVLMACAFTLSYFKVFLLEDEPPKKHDQQQYIE